MLVFLLVIAIVLFAVLLTALICFFRVFYSPPRKPLGPDEYDIPIGPIYEPFRDEMIAWQKRARAMPQEVFSVRSFDGLTLSGRYFEYRPGAPIEILFHGYKGNGERDLSGAVERCFTLGRSALIVSQRASAGSDGHVISFGINERRDCRTWVDFVIGHFGDDVKIILTGISMGASTVLMAAGEPLPKNVVCILADCGYTSPREIIRKVVRDMHLPTLLYPFIRLGAAVFGHFDLEETSSLDAIRRCTLPVILIHGEADDFVPWEMSRRMYEACSAPKLFHSVPGAGHGLAYSMDKEGYIAAVLAFEQEQGFLQDK